MINETNLKRDIWEENSGFNRQLYKVTAKLQRFYILFFYLTYFF